MFSLATSAVKRRDFEFAVTVMESFVLHLRKRPDIPTQMFSASVLVEGCVGGGGGGERVVGLVMEWYQIARLEFSQEMINSIIEWIKR